MMKKFSLTAAILVLTASWVCAGNLGALADAAAGNTPTPLYVKPGTLIKAEYRSGMKTVSDEDASSTNLKAEPVAANSDQKFTARPAIAFKPKSAAAMAPPPHVEAVGIGRSSLVAEAKQDALDLEGDLEKDLVLSPPPQKSDTAREIEAKPVITQNKPVAEKPASVTPIQKIANKNNVTKVKKATPTPQYASSPKKPIRKVRPVSQDSWQFPAGAHDYRPVPRANEAFAASNFSFPNVSSPNGGVPNYVTSAPRPSMGSLTPNDRIVRDGITIKLAPASAPVTAPSPYAADQRDDYSSGSDLLSTAAEIIGLPFAFISSLF
ncbi:MAG: hypothetical protein V1897_10705 [Pseudomonadota bacterium]